MIYDCFTFFNELDLLEIRLNILDSVVDKFVLVEATKTFSGAPKPLYFKENRERYKKFIVKIIHIVVDDMPEIQQGISSEYWELEFFQRNAIARGLIGCKNGDVILVGDLDEVPNPEKINRYRNRPGIKVFKQRMYLYYLNNADLKNPYWTNSSTRMLSYSDFVKNGSSPQKSKFLRGSLIGNGGWHFSYLGGAQKVAEKVKSFAHILPADTVLKYENLPSIREKMNRGEFLLDQKEGNKRYAGVVIDGSFPRYIVENASKYPQLICKVSITPYNKVVLWKNQIISGVVACLKNTIFKNNIREANYEISE